MVHELAKVDKTFKAILNEARRLDRFYITSRYPTGLPGGTPFEVYCKEDLQEAREDVGAVFRVSKDFLGKTGVI